MGVLDSIVLIEALGLALLAVFLIVVARRRSAARRDAAQDAGTVGLVGGAAMMHDRHDAPSDFGGGYGGDAGGV